MKWLIMTLLCFCIMLSCEARSFIEKDIASSVTIVSNSPIPQLFEDKSGYIGSGVQIINKHGVFVWTAAHVVSNNKFGKPTILFRTRSANGKDGFFIQEGRVVGYSSKIDLAVIRIEKPFLSSVSTSFYNGDDPPVGSSVFVVGSAGGLGGSGLISNGIISKYSHEETTTIFLTSSISHGSSGGGVFLEDGRCIGIITQMWVDKYAIALSYQDIRKWAKEKNMEYALNID